MARRVVLVVFPDLQLLDLAGPLEVFAMADRFSDSELSEYVAEVVSPDAGAIRASSGLEIGANRAIGACRGPIDTLVVVGGRGVAQAIVDDRLVAWIRSAAQRSRRVTSVCSGAFLLARAGLLDGRRATTHWATSARLARMFPEVTVDPDPIFIRDGNVWTSAGVTAGMDLALALVEDDLGPERAREIARYLVLFVQRSGGQSQFSAQLAAQRPERDTLVQLASWIADHLGDDLSVPVLAVRTSMSVRNFSRRFAQEFGSTPAAYVEAVRVEAGRRLLESTRRGLTDIARDCGFGTVETMHRSFQRTIRVTPGQYRQHFSPRTPA
ncbi:MAG: GlxA family transcriptional regulator [Mycobacterium sp.]|uniref:GlxA family transcriptional regulator n=1 Tax=Mycobacterium sp. TaxID=1785 RepID=UPI003BB0AA18